MTATFPFTIVGGVTMMAEHIDGGIAEYLDNEQVDTISCENAERLVEINGK